MLNTIRSYKKAYSPMYRTTVSIIRVRNDDRNQPIFHALVDNITILFRYNELSNFSY